VGRTVFELIAPILPHFDPRRNRSNRQTRF